MNKNLSVNINFGEKPRIEPRIKVMIIRGFVALVVIVASVAAVEVAALQAIEVIGSIIKVKWHPLKKPEDATISIKENDKNK